MRLGASIPLFGYVVAGLLMAYGVYCAIRVHKVSIIFDSRFAPLVMQRCQLLLVPEFLRNNHAQHVMQTLQKRVPGLSDCSIRYQSFQTAYIVLSSVQPIVCINQKYILTSACTIIPISEFEELVVERLPNIIIDPAFAQGFGGQETYSAHPEYNRRMNDEKNNIHDLFDFITKLPNEVYEQYDIVWRDKTAIHLRNRLLPHIEVLAWHATRFTPELIQAIEILKKRVEEIRERYKKIIDVRVKGQVIIRRMQGGNI